MNTDMMAFSGVSGSMEEDFFSKTPILKNCSPERNQVAAHAQKRVTVPLKPTDESSFTIRKTPLKEFHLFFCCKKVMQLKIMLKFDFGAMLFMDDSNIIMQDIEKRTLLHQSRFSINDQS